MNMPTIQIQRNGQPGVYVVKGEDGRITERRVQLSGFADARVFKYAPSGGLKLVYVPDGLAEWYEYDFQARRSFDFTILRETGRRTFSYDWDNSLISAGNVQYKHDEQTGFRTSKTDPQRGTTRYDYAPNGLLLRVTLPEGRVIDYAYDREGRRANKFVNGRMVERYGWERTRLIGLNDGTITEFEYTGGYAPAAMRKNGRRFTIVSDQVGTPLAVLDEQGRLLKRMDCDSFGNLILDTNPGQRLPFGFAAGLYDPDTGLVRFGVRDYDPDVGRFTARDPLWPAGGEDDPYGYCLDDPVNLADWSGLDPSDLDFPPGRPGTIPVTSIAPGFDTPFGGYYLKTKVHSRIDKRKEICPRETTIVGQSGIR
ncbi:MAG: RHS repeat-associated core domain-containing protein [Desulfovibrionaceae bacterium]|nr:RHS repeat-associated core domain-containing protein [Desulfovibrionaceae bacterium]